MLEISDTINQPILMKENNEKTGAYFLIMTGFKVIYIYKLNIKSFSISKSTGEEYSFRWILSCPAGEKQI